MIFLWIYFFLAFVIFFTLRFNQFNFRLRSLYYFFSSLQGFFLFRFFLLMTIFLLSFEVQAKDLSHRLGLGYINGIFDDLGGVAARYYPDSYWGVAGILGMDTKDDDSKFAFVGKVYRIVFTEDHMNFYTGLGAGLLTQGDKKKSSTATDAENLDGGSGFHLSAFIGGEFFLTGLENLGFSFEMGIGVSTVSDEVRFFTIGDSPLKAGIIFYF